MVRTASRLGSGLRLADGRGCFSASRPDPSTASAGLPRQRLAVDLGSPGSLMGVVLRLRWRCFVLAFTASAGLEGHLAHHVAGEPAGSQGRVKYGWLAPHSHRLERTFTVPAGLEGHFAHHRAADGGSPGKPK